ncbi:MAG: hypothetical protein LUE17_06555, partial [Planctomycetaceae bacterium]|nr:hypothetical protein [Planctomycetaceae bacterium]
RLSLWLILILHHYADVTLSAGVVSLVHTSFLPSKSSYSNHKAVPNSGVYRPVRTPRSILRDDDAAMPDDRMAATNTFVSMTMFLIPNRIWHQEG